MIFIKTLIAIVFLAGLTLCADSYDGRVKRVAYLPIDGTNAKVSMWVSPTVDNDINHGKWCFYQGTIDNVKALLAMALSAEANKTLVIVYTPNSSLSELTITSLYIDDN